MRSRVWLLSLAFIAACGFPKLPQLGGGDDAQMPDACVGLQCQVTQSCADQGKPETTLKGMIVAPNKLTPLYGVNVYVPNADPGPVPTGVQCVPCSAPLPGSPVVQTTSDTAGQFTLTKVPSGDNIPVVIAIGKWQRRLVIPHIEACTEMTLTLSDTTLPKSHADTSQYTTLISLPKIALSTGAADALECLLRKIGIDDSEFGTDGSNLAVELFAETITGAQGTSSFATGFPGGSGSFATTNALWLSGTTAADHATKLGRYDMVILSCEGGQQPTNKPQDALDGMKQYADSGGRVFASHWHNIWIEGSMTAPMQKPLIWPSLVMWNNGGTTFGPADDLIDESKPKGVAFATWLQALLPAGTVRDHIAIQANSGKNTVQQILSPEAARWTYWPNGGVDLPQNFAFTTPIEAAPALRCGKVAFSDMHVASGSTSMPSQPFPSGCVNAPLSPQELAIMYMLFDLQSCASN